MWFVHLLDSMASLGDLLKINGVAVAGQFTLDGKLVDYKANVDMSKEMAETAGQFCATVSMMFNTLAGALTQLSKMQWVPQKIWSAGGDWTVVIAI